LRYLFVLALPILFLSACTSSEPDADLIIRNASIIDIASGEITEDQMIGIAGDTIQWIRSMEDDGLVASAKSFDARGGFVMPGLWDMHVHFRGGDTLIPENKNLLPLFLAYGVTTVRDAGGDITPAVMDWKQQIAGGNLAGPTIFTSGPKLDGERPGWPGSIPVVEPGDVARALDSLESLGVDYVKMYDGSLSAQRYYDLIAEADARGLKTTGHMPMSASILEGIERGLDGTEHLYYVLKACSPFADSLTAAGMGYGMLPIITETYDPELADSVYGIMADRDVYVTPTMHIGETLAQLAAVDHSEDEMLAYIGPGIQGTYQGRLRSAIRAAETGNTSRADFVARTKTMLKPMYDAGVPIVAGSDCGPFNSFVYPGLSIHQELQLFVDAGLSPREALETATRTGPVFFGRTDDYGAVAPGKVADLLILERNPLEDIANSRSIQAVVKAGTLRDQPDLDVLLEGIRYR